VTNPHDNALIPDDLVYLLTTDRIGHVSSIRPDGGIATYLMWVDWDGEHVVTSSPMGSRKGHNWRHDPHASVSVVDRDDMWRYVTVRGRVTDIRPDGELAFIDKMSERYTSAPYRFREGKREIFEITLDHVRFGHGRRR
jgi:PPOX class probable F420-dependent enzyme